LRKISRRIYDEQRSFFLQLAAISLYIFSRQKSQYINLNMLEDIKYTRTNLIFLENKLNWFPVYGRDLIRIFRSQDAITNTLAFGIMKWLWSLFFYFKRKLPSMYVHRGGLKMLGDILNLLCIFSRGEIT